MRFDSAPTRAQPSSTKPVDVPGEQAEVDAKRAPAAGRVEQPGVLASQQQLVVQTHAADQGQVDEVAAGLMRPSQQMDEDGGMAMERLRFPVDGGALLADRWAGIGPPIVLLHAGVADRRSWYAVGDRLAGSHSLLAYDRRGFGDSPPGTGPFRHLDDLIMLLDRIAEGPVWLVGSSMGGLLALDAAVAHPDRVAGLVLLAPAVSGAPEPEQVDPGTQRLSDLLDAAFDAGDLEEVNRLATWLWLDGPTSVEGRVPGPARELALAMNAVVVGNSVPEDSGSSGLDVWPRVEEVAIPATVVWGDLDIPFLNEQCEQLAARLPQARSVVLPGRAHLPYLEDPDAVADVVRAAITLT